MFNMLCKFCSYKSFKFIYYWLMTNPSLQVCYFPSCWFRMHIRRKISVYDVLNVRIAHFLHTNPMNRNPNFSDAFLKRTKIKGERWFSAYLDFFIYLCVLSACICGTKIFHLKFQNMCWSFNIRMSGKLNNLHFSE